MSSAIFVWVFVLIAYLGARLAYYLFYKNSPITLKEKIMCEKSLKVLKVFVICIRLLIVAASLLILIGLRYDDVKSVVNYVFALTGVILPCYFGILGGYHLEKLASERPLIPGNSGDK